MTTWIDITMALSPEMAVWPGNDEPFLRRTAAYEDGADSITSILTTDLHNGTHVDAPLHYLEGGSTAETIPLEHLMGEATVIDVRGVPEITADVLEAAAPADATRLLLRTDNSATTRASRTDFDTSYVALTVDAAQWLVARNTTLIGVDYCSVALYEGDPETHRELLRNDVTILEGLVLDDIAPGTYELRCLPLLVVGGEAAPARALLRPL